MRIQHISLFVLAVLFSVSIGVPTVQAQSTREYWRTRTNESAGIDYDALRAQRTQNTRVRNAIEKLDDDPVEDLPIPVLFGVALDDLTANFGDDRDGGARQHEGLDILAPSGTPIVTPTEAVVIRIGDGSGSGTYVSTANPGGEMFVYMHLDAVADIETGDTLAVGDVIGYVGNTGNAADGPAHLHLEIREDREAMDPLPRLTKEFSLREKMASLEAAVEDADDEEEFIALVVEEFLGTFLQARAQGIDMPEAVDKALPLFLSDGATLGTRDLSLGSQGTDVRALQSMLIAAGYLEIDTPTEYFGPLTEAAVRAYQEAQQIEPASGYFGPLTRARLVGGEPVSKTALRAQLVAKIAELTALVEKLQAQLRAQSS